MVIQLLVDSNKILRFMGFVAKDLCGYVTIFGFRVSPTVNTINNM
jgi:hypothetical protein